MRRHIGQPLAHEIAHGGHLGIIQRGIVADDDVIGALLVDLHAVFAQFLKEIFVAQHERPFARIEQTRLHGGRLAGGEHLLARHGQPHAPELFDIIRRVVRGIVGQKQIIAAALLHRADKIQRTVQQPVAQIKRAVHIQQEALDVPDVLLVLHGYTVLYAMCNRYALILSQTAPLCNPRAQKKRDGFLCTVPKRSKVCPKMDGSRGFSRPIQALAALKARKRR